LGGRELGVKVLAEVYMAEVYNRRDFSQMPN
jgi:hypothetical protein